MRLTRGTPGLTFALTVCAAACQPSNNPRFSGTLDLSVVNQAGDSQVQTSLSNPCTLNVDFGNVRVTRQVGLTADIANNSNSPIVLTPNTSGLNPEFSAAFGDQQAQILAAGSDLQVSLLFQAETVGPVTSTLEVTTDAPLSACKGSGSGGATIVIVLTANAVNFTLDTEPAAIDFGATVVGQSFVHSITLSNTTAFAINGLKAAITGAAAPDFNFSGVPTSLAAGASAAVQVTYAPLAAKPSSSAAITFTGVDGESAFTTLLGEPFASGIALSASALDFGYVLPPATAIVCTTARNLIATPITLQRIVDFGTGGDVFSFSSVDSATPPNAAALPVTLQPGHSAEVCFEFAPPSPASDKQFTGQATIQSDDPSGINPKVTLAGWGGGPQLSCHPSSLDFGRVLDGYPSTLPITCTNVGSSIAEANLTLGQPTVPGSSLFSATFDKFTNVYTADGIAPGQSAQIDVTYSPSLVTHDQAVLVLTTNAGNGTPLQIPLNGQGLDLAPCEYQIAPSHLDFGNVVSLSHSVLSFAVENLGAGNCLISNLHIANQPSAEFSLLPPSIPPDSTGVITLPPAPPGGSSSLEVQVGFAPVVLENDSADVLFTISDPANPQQDVHLLGTSEPTCLLVEPSLKLDFGTVGSSQQQGSPCSSASREFSIFNTCTTTATIQSITLQHGEGDVAAQFALPAQSGLPLVLQPGGLAAFQMVFAPTSIGSHSGQVLISDGTVDTTLTVTGNAVQAPRQTDDFTVSAPTADVLFIVEVGSDASAQQKVAQALPAFVKAAGVVDYRIAVTTDNNTSGTSAENGRLLPCSNCSLVGTSPTIVSPSSIPPGGTAADPGTALADLYASVPNNAFSGSARYYFLSLYNALVRAPLPGVDFFRPGAYFAAVADAQQGDDNSFDGAGQHAENWFAGFFEICTGQPYLFGWNQIEPSSLVTGTGLAVNSQLPSDIGQMITTTNGLALNLTDSAWGGALSGIWNAATDAAGYYALSATPPNGMKSLTVSVNGTAIPPMTVGVANWTYNVATNTVSFTANQPLSLGDQIAVSYPIGCQ